MELVGSYLTADIPSLGSPYRVFPKPAKDMAPIPDYDLNSYYDQPDAKVNKMVFKSTYERRVGGSTWHWLGNCPRLLPSDFKSATLYGLGKDWPIDYTDLEPWYCQAEKELGVSGDHEGLNGLFGAFRSEPFPMHKIWPSYSDLQIEQALRGAENSWSEYNAEPMVLKSTPQARNSQPYDGRPVCTGNSSCVPICPVGAKYDGAVHIEKAQKAGAILVEKAIVTAIVTDGKTGPVTGVQYMHWDSSTHAVTADIVVVAANAIETPKLLLLSGCCQFQRPGRA